MVQRLMHGYSSIGHLEPFSPPRCIETTCLAGFMVATQQQCHADAACYATPSGTWCTGECPSGGQLELTDGTAACVPPSGA